MVPVVNQARAVGAAWCFAMHEFRDSYRRGKQHEAEVVS